MKTVSSTLALAGFVASVAGHGFVTDPPARQAGDALKAACGEQVYYNQVSDNYGNIQGELQIASNQNDYDAAACDVWLCKGYKFADNSANVQSYTAGQTVDFTVDIRAPHEGVANVSIVDTASNSIIAGPLISWDVYASSSYAIPANQTKFSITLPTDLGSKCATAGDCVIQWFWDAKSIDQTYESCVDFTIGGSGSGSETSPSSAAVSSAPAATSAVAASSSAVEAEATSAAPVETAPTSPTTSAAAIPSASGKACTRLTGAAASSAAAALSASATPSPVVSKTKTKSACTKKTRTAAASASASAVAVSAADAVTTAAPTSPTSVAAAPSSSKKACTRLSASPSGVAVTASPASPTSAEAEVTPAPSATTAAAESQVSDVLSALPALTTVIPSEILTSVIPTAIPTSAATGIPVPSTPLPEGTTLKDLLEWVSWVLKTFFSHKGKHSRDISA